MILQDINNQRIGYLLNKKQSNIHRHLITKPITITSLSHKTTWGFDNALVSRIISDALPERYRSTARLANPKPDSNRGIPRPSLRPSIAYPTTAIQ